MEGPLNYRYDCPVLVLSRLLLYIFEACDTISSKVDVWIKTEQVQGHRGHSKYRALLASLMPPDGSDGAL